MGFSKSKKENILNYILKEIRDKRSPYENTLKVFNTTRTTIRNYLKELEGKDFIKQGNLKGTYLINDYIVENFNFKIKKGLSESDIFEQTIEKFILNHSQNVIDTIKYSFTEMVNNAIDHSNGKNIEIGYFENYFDIGIIIKDDGVGIFKKIMKDHNLKNEEEAIFELKKGKLTSDPENHAGEGIFFTSKVVDHFVIYSCKKYFFSKDDGYKLITKDLEVSDKGTYIGLIIDKSTTKTTYDVFEEFTTENSEGMPFFNKTIVEIQLAKDYSNNLVSRSEAKRVLSRVEKFKKVILDFNKVDFIGQAFSDEIFRVFQKKHPDIEFMPINTNKKIDFMIKRTLSSNI